MANLLVYIDLVDGRPTEAALGALAYARRIATRHGATVCGFVPLARQPEYAEDDLCVVLSRHGADKLLIATDAALAGPPHADVHGVALTRARERCRCAIVLLSDGPAAAALGPALAGAMGAHLAAHDASEPLPAERPLVVRLLRPPAPEPTSTDEAEVVPLSIA